MPTPAKIAPDQFVTIAKALLEESGPDAVTMALVADRLGVRPPSLYKHVRDRDDLMRRVVASFVDDLNDRAEAAVDLDDPRQSIRREMEALKRFAEEHPRAYALILGPGSGSWRPSPSDLERSLRPLLAAATALVGEAHALDAARFLVAWANGSITMRLNDMLQMGGDLDAAWEWGLDHAVAAVAATR